MSIFMLIGNIKYLIAHSRYSIILYCKEHNINLEEFNIPVIIPKGVINCSNLLRGCKAFNQSVLISNDVKYCDYMFYGCENYNQPTWLPTSVISHKHTFEHCPNYKYGFLTNSIYNDFHNK